MGSCADGRHTLAGPTTDTAICDPDLLERFHAAPVNASR